MNSQYKLIFLQNPNFYNVNKNVLILKYWDQFYCLCINTIMTDDEMHIAPWYVGTEPKM